jgi:putative MATE family efflux protein
MDTNIKTQREEELNGKPIVPLLGKLALPAIAGMVMNALYNLIDTIFIGRGVGAYGVGGLAIAFPMQVAMFSIALLFGFGAASIISRALGAGKREQASVTAGTALSTGLLFSIVVLIFLRIFLTPTLQLLGATPDILPYAREYARIIIFAMPIIIVVVISHNIARAQGHTEIVMVSLFIGAGGNIILDALFIFGLGMGIAGAALATVIARCGSLVFMFLFMRSPRNSVPIQPEHFRPQRSLVKNIIAIGFPGFIRQMGASFLFITINNVLRVYGTSMYISSFGIINRFLLFSLMPLLGIVQGFQPIAGYNYGARNWKRVSQSVFTACGATMLLGTMFFVIVMLFPKGLLSIFTTNEEAIAIGAHAIRRIMLLVPIIGVQFVGANFFIAIGKAPQALLLSMSRQILFLIPLAIILPRFFGVEGVWFAFPCSDLLAFTITTILLVREIRHLHS